MTGMLKRIKRDPRPIILAAMSPVRWLTADQIAPTTGYSPEVVRRWLAKLAREGLVWRQPGAQGKVEWKRKAHSN